MRKYLWVWIVLAFVAGLAPGVGFFAYYRASYMANNRQIMSRNAELVEQNQQLKLKAESAEASLSALTAEAARQQPGALATTGAPTGAATGGTAPTPPAGEVAIVAKAVSPSPVGRGAQLALTVKVSGTVERAHMRIVGPGSFDKTYFLGKTGTEGATQVWEKTIEAPPTPGAYHYYAIAFAGGKKYTMPQTAELTFSVK